jgi:DNA polymerase-3 subunit delta
MKLKPEQLAGHLKKGLAPVYLVGGDEPLQVEESCDAIRKQAREAGYTEREVMSVEKGFDWNQLTQSAGSMSLFGDKKILELRMPAGKPGKEGAKAFAEYLDHLPEDTLLMVICGKLDSATVKTKWVQSLEKAGVMIQVWPVDANRLPDWIAQRMRSRGLQASGEAISLLSERVEGNLLAAAQEIEKLLLLHGSGRVDVDAVAASVADSARFSLFDLVDHALAGRQERVVRMLNGLRGEGVEPILILWALTREIRSLALMSTSLSQGMAVEAVLARHRVWEKKKPLMKSALKRHSRARWYGLLRKCAQIDRIIKGAAVGKPWDELLQLGLWLAGRPLLRA